jgi:hypothetical protein
LVTSQNIVISQGEVFISIMNDFNMSLPVIRDYKHEVLSSNPSIAKTRAQTQTTRKVSKLGVIGSWGHCMKLCVELCVEIHVTVYNYLSHMWT